MKVNVERQLNAGTYFVAFRVADFSAEEIQRMQSFGVPTVAMFHGINPRQALRLGLNQINEKWKAGFVSESEAREYETRVLKDIRDAIQSLRDKKDEFTSSSEVAI